MMMVARQEEVAVVVEDVAIETIVMTIPVEGKHLAPLDFFPREVTLAPLVHTGF